MINYLLSLGIHPQFMLGLAYGLVAGMVIGLVTRVIEWAIT